MKKSFFFVLFTTCLLAGCGKDSQSQSNVDAAIGGCHLKTPIDLSHAQNQDTLTFTDVVTDIPADPTAPEDTQNKDFTLFEIYYGTTPTGLLGGAISDSAGGRFGFANTYEGSFNIHGNSVKSGKNSWQTTTQSRADGTKIELGILFNGSKLLGVRLTYPLQGENRTLCIRSMRVK